MPRYPMQDPPPGFFVAPVTLPDGDWFVAGQLLFGDDEGFGELVALVPFTANIAGGLSDRRLRLYRRRDEAVRVCEGAYQATMRATISESEE